jgi:hypothetical protein
VFSELAIVNLAALEPDARSDEESCHKKPARAKAKAAAPGWRSDVHSRAPPD